MPRQTKSTFIKSTKFKSALFLAFLILSLLFLLVGIKPLPERATPFSFGVEAPTTQHLFEKDNLSISYPNSWSLHLTPSGNHGDNNVMALIYVPWHSAPQIVIFSKPFTSNKLSDVVKWREEKLHAANGYKIISSSTLATEAIAEYSYNSQSILGNYTIHCKDLHILKDATGYIFSFCSYAKDWEKLSDTFSKIIDSIHILE